jgi:uncharacterized membrane protein YdjX (TVP38/TMEM64 family)
VLDLAIHWVELARASFWLSLAFYLVFVVGVMGLPITLFPIIGGVLFPFWIAFPLNVFAATTGGWLSFMLTRTLGEKTLAPYLHRKFSALEKFTKMEGFRTVLFLRLIGVPPFIVSNYALGFSEVTHIDFITGTMIGILPWMGIVTYLANSLWAAALVGGQQGLAKALTHALAPLLIVSLSILGVLALNYWLKRRRHSNL